MLPNANDLHYFLEITNTLNISRAAERLGISQPSLSQSIKRLENNMDTPLLIRSKSGVTLTKEAQKLIPKVRQLINDWNELKNETLKNQESIRGTYTLGAHSSVALYTFQHFFKELLDQFPELSIQCQHNLSRIIADDIINFKIDFGIVVNPPKHPDLVIKQLCKDDVTFWYNSKLLKTASLKKQKQTLICDPELIQTQALQKSLKKTGINFSRMLHSSNLEVISHLSETGAGIAILPSRVALKRKDSPLKRLPGQAPVFKDDITFIYRVESLQTQSTKMLIQWITQKLKKLI